MAQQAKPTLLRDEAGAMYFIPGEQLEQYRVPADRAAEVQQKVRAATQQDPEVAGFSFEQALTPGSLGFDNPSAPTMDDSPTQTGSVQRFPQDIF
jgi:hypothetical protein